MKLCLLLDFDCYTNIRGGAEIQARILAGGLAERGIDVHIVVPNLIDNKNETIKVEPNLTIHRYKSSIRKKILSKGRSVAQGIYKKDVGMFHKIHDLYVKWSARNLAKGFKKIHKKEEFDVVHANNTEPILALKYIKGIRKTGHLRDYLVFRHKLPSDVEYITITKRLKEMFGKDCIVINDPLGKNKISKLSKTEARKKLRITREMILFVGNLIQEKNPLAFVELAKRFPNKQFIILGDGPLQPEKLPNLIHLKKVGQKEIADYYRAADMLFYPASCDFGGFGLNVIESLANGTPVLAYNIEGIDDVVDKENIVKDLDGAKEKIIKGLKEVNVDEIRKRFNQEHILDKMVGFFENGLSKQKI